MKETFNKPRPNEINRFVYDAEFGETIAVAKFLHKFGNSTVNAVDVAGCSALLMAASRGYKKTVEFLLEKGAEVDQKTPEGITALMLAAKNGHGEVVGVLLSAGASLEEADNLGQTAINYAEKGEHDGLVSFMNAYHKLQKEERAALWLEETDCGKGLKTAMPVPRRLVPRGGM